MLLISFVLFDAAKVGIIFLTGYCFYFIDARFCFVTKKSVDQVYFLLSLIGATDRSTAIDDGAYFYFDL